jgi:hypothetical protein
MHQKPASNRSDNMDLAIEECIVSFSKMQLNPSEVTVYDEFIPAFNEVTINAMKKMEHGMEAFWNSAFDQVSSMAKTEKEVDLPAFDHTKINMKSEKMWIVEELEDFTLDLDSPSLAADEETYELDQASTRVTPGEARRNSVLERREENGPAPRVKRPWTSEDTAEISRDFVLKRLKSEAREKAPRVLSLKRPSIVDTVESSVDRMLKRLRSEVEREKAPRVSAFERLGPKVNTAAPKIPVVQNLVRKRQAPSEQPEDSLGEEVCNAPAKRVMVSVDENNMQKHQGSQFSRGLVGQASHMRAARRQH